MRFVHIWFVPLVPLGSYRVYPGYGDEDLGEKVSFSFKALINVWLKTFLIFATLGALLKLFWLAATILGDGFTMWNRELQEHVLDWGTIFGLPITLGILAGCIFVWKIKDRLFNPQLYGKPPSAQEFDLASNPPPPFAEHRVQQQAQSQYPQAQGHYPQAQSQYPQAQSQYPQAQSQYPQAQSQYPQAQSQYPQAQSQYPQAQSQYPQAQSQYPQSQYPQSQYPQSQYPQQAQHSNGYGWNNHG